MLRGQRQEDLWGFLAGIPVSRSVGDCLRGIRQTVIEQDVTAVVTRQMYANFDRHYQE